MRELIVCRCEEVTAGEITDAVREGACSIDEVKLATRAGMGVCQGRTCARLVGALVAHATGDAHAARTMPTRRWPVRPVRLAVLRRPLPEGPPVQLGLVELDPDEVET